MEKRDKSHLMIPASYEEEAFMENNGEQEPPSGKRERIVLGSNTSTCWPYQCGRTDSYGMTYTDAVLKAKSLGYLASEVQSESYSDDGCDMCSYPDGGGTYESFTVTYYVLEK